MVFGMKQLSNKKLNPNYFNLFFVVIEIVSAIAIHYLFSKPKTDVLGSPLLLDNGARPLQFQLFALIQVVIIPAWLFFNFTAESSIIRKLWQKISTFWQNYGSDEFDQIHFTRVILTIYLIVILVFQFSGNLFFQNLTYQILFLFLIVVLIILFYKFSWALSNHFSGSKLMHLSIFLDFFLFGSCLFFKFRLSNIHLAFWGAAIPVVFYVSYLIHSVISQKNRNFNKQSMNLLNIYLGIPALSFILFSSLPGKMNLHAFESFSYANVKLFLQGFIPWKDFNVEHGVWEDLLRPFIGGYLARDFDWGTMGGVVSLVRPLEFALLGICFYLFRPNMLLTSFLLSLSYLVERTLGIGILVMPRILPIVFLTLVFKNYLQRPRYGASISLGLISCIALLWSPEGLYPVACIALILCLNIIFSKFKKIQLLHLITYLIFLLVFLFLPLMFFGLSRDWIAANLTNASGYLFAWGAPIQFNLGFVFILFFILVPIVTLLFLGKGIADLKILNLGGQHSVTFLVPAFFATYAFFVKFLGWPDWHIKQPASLLLISVFMWVAVVWKPEKEVARVLSIFVATILILPLTDTSLQAQDVNLRNAAIQSSAYDEYTESYEARAEEVFRSFAKFVDNKQGTRILDFGNEPVTWFGFGKFAPSGGKTNVLGLFSAKSQTEFTEKLALNPPSAVIWGGEFGYWAWPFNGNWMKQYLVSEYILRNYQPVQSNGNYTIMVSKSDSKPDPASLRALTSLNCDWLGGVDNFKTPRSNNIGPIIRSSLSKDKMTGHDSYNLELDTFRSMNGLFIESNKPVSVVIKRQDAVGEIRFKYSSPGVTTPIWLAGCPVYRLVDEKSTWSMSFSPADAIVKVYSNNSSFGH